jgi:hypothetical protein
VQPPARDEAIMTVLYLILKVAAALLALRYVGWPLAKLLWRGLVMAWPFIKGAWGGVFRAFAGNPVTFLVTMVLFAALGLAAAGHGPLREWLFRPSPDQTRWNNGAFYAAARLGMAVVTSLVLAPLMVAVPRTVLNDRVQGGWGAALRNNLGWLLALQLCITGLLTFSLLASAVGFVRGMIDLIMQIAILILAWRLALVLPAVAIGTPAKSAEARLDASWTTMEGRFWYTFWLFLCTLLPMLVLMTILARLGVPKPPNPPPISLPPPAPLPVTKILLITQGMLGVAQVFTVALGMSAASQLYARMVPKKP